MILRLENSGITREVWCYFTVKDILQLLTVNKNVRTLCKRMNDYFPQRIKIRLMSNLTDKQCAKVLNNRISSPFHNISTLDISNINHFDNDIALSKSSMSVLYNCDSLRQSLKVLTVEVKSDDGLCGMSKLTKLSSLDISYSSITDNALINLTCLTNLTCLSIRSCETMSSYRFSSPINYPIMILNIVCCNRRNYLRVNFTRDRIGLSNECLSSLSSLTNLTELDLSLNCNLSDQGLISLSTLEQLKSLNLTSCRRIIGLSFLTLLTNLTILNLAQCGLTLTSEGLQHLQSLPKLTDLNLSECGRFTIILTEEFGETLNKISQLSYLDLSGSIGVTDSSLLPLTRLTRLKILKV